MIRPAIPLPATLLGAVRGGYGLLQLAAPALVADRIVHRPLDARGRHTARLLGARQLGQALASGRSPGYPILALGVEVDLLHAASMLALAAVDRRRRRTGCADALVATGFAAAGALAARAAAGEQPPAPPHTLGRLRQHWAEGLARVLVPGYPADPTRLLTGSTQGTLLPFGPPRHETRTQ